MQPSPEKPTLVYTILIKGTIMGSEVIKQTDQLWYKTSSHFTHFQHYVLSIQKNILLILYVLQATKLNLYTYVHSNTTRSLRG